MHPRRHTWLTTAKLDKLDNNQRRQAETVGWLEVEIFFFAMGPMPAK